MTFSVFQVDWFTGITWQHKYEIIRNDPLILLGFAGSEGSKMAESFKLESNLVASF